MKKIILSIIIPTYKRTKKLSLIIKELSVQIPKNINTEIIISDSSDKFFYKNIDKYNKKNLFIKYIFNKKNSNAIKRNLAIKKAKGKYLIFLDDDCLPSKLFIENYLKLFAKIKDNDILCGSVKYLKTKIKNENFYRYRQSRHFVFIKKKLTRSNYLNASNIVTMNMGMKNSNKLKKTKYFNPGFGAYGFEDYEFGFRLIEKGFNFIPSNPLVYHLDERNFRSYLDKIYFMSKHSVKILKKLNKKAWQSTIYYKIDNNIIVKLLKKFNVIYPVFEIIEKVIVIIENNVFLYLPRLYRFAILMSYCRGYYDRKIKNKYYKKWYK